MRCVIVELLEMFELLSGCTYSYDHNRHRQMRCVDNLSKTLIKVGHRAVCKDDEQLVTWQSRLQVQSLFILDIAPLLVPHLCHFAYVFYDVVEMFWAVPLNLLLCLLVQVDDLISFFDLRSKVIAIQSKTMARSV